MVRQEEGCLPVKGLELDILREVDIIYNLGLRRGGWKVKVVLPMSGAPVDATVSNRDRSKPHPDLGYPTDCVVVEAAHPKVLLGNQQGRFNADDRQRLASLALHDVMKAVALLRGGADDLQEERVMELYAAAAEHPVYKGKVWTVAELRAGSAKPESSQQRASALARRNGECREGD